MATSKRHARLLNGGPYQGETVYLSDDATSTITFGAKGHYGRYHTGSGQALDWQPLEAAMKGTPGPTRKRDRQALTAILKEAQHGSNTKENEEG